MGIGLSKNQPTCFMPGLIRPNTKRYKVKPTHHPCNSCKTLLEFTKDNFFTCNHYKFGLSYTCKVCDLKRKSIFDKSNPNQLKIRRNNWTKNNLELGLCSKCKSTRLLNSNSFCEKHFYQDISHKALGTKKKWEFVKQIYINQQGKCKYTHKDLILGLNASIDHIKPIAKFPELKYEETNLQWVDLTINRMKRDLLEEEFINICKIIVAPTPA